MSAENGTLVTFNYSGNVAALEQYLTTISINVVSVTDAGNASVAVAFSVPASSDELADISNAINTYTLSTENGGPAIPSSYSIQSPYVGNVAGFVVAGSIIAHTVDNTKYTHFVLSAITKKAKSSFTIRAVNYLTQQIVFTITTASSNYMCIVKSPFPVPFSPDTALLEIQISCASDFVSIQNIQFT